MSCAHLQRFSNYIAYFVRKRTGKKNNNYLYDFLFAVLIKAICDGQVEVFLEICKSVNFLVSLDKTFWGATIIVFLGMVIDTITQTVKVPGDKIDKAVSLIQDLKSRKKAMVLQLQKLTGLLNFLCHAIIPGRAFTRRFYTKFGNLNLKQHYHVRVEAEMKRDCEMWLEFLRRPEACSRPFLDFTRVLTADKINFSDASRAENLGFGCVFGDSWMQGNWEHNYIQNLQPSIEYLDL